MRPKIIELIEQDTTSLKISHYIDMKKMQNMYMMHLFVLTIKH